MRKTFLELMFQMETILYKNSYYRIDLEIFSLTAHLLYEDKASAICQMTAASSSSDASWCTFRQSKGEKRRSG